MEVIVVRVGLAQPTGIQGRLPENRTARPGLVLAGGVSEA